MRNQIHIRTADGSESIDRPQITQVTAREVFKRDGVTLKGYRYTAHLVDGSTEIVRDLATRLYDFAFMYSSVVATGKTGLSSVFSFGKKPASHYQNDVLGQYPVTLEASQ